MKHEEKLGEGKPTPDATRTSGLAEGADWPGVNGCDVKISGRRQRCACGAE